MPEQAWPEPDVHPEASLDASLQELVNAGRSLGVPSTGVVAAAIQVAQACRAVSDGGFFDLADVTLVNCRRATGGRHALARPGILPFLLARSEY